MSIEIRLIGRIVRVRTVPRHGSGNVRVWDELERGQIHTPTRLSYEQLRELGEGVHDL